MHFLILQLFTLFRPLLHAVWLIWDNIYMCVLYREDDAETVKKWEDIRPSFHQEIERHYDNKDHCYKRMIKCGEIACEFKLSVYGMQ